MRILYLVFIFFTNIFIFNPNLGLAENNIKLKIIVTVNEHAITNIDINNQIKFLKSMYNNENFENNQIYSSALNNLIYEVLKKSEKNINKEKLFIEKDKLISLEKNKKLQIYSNKYLEDLKENSLIKYFK